jgi:hypothetical protein
MAEHAKSIDISNNPELLRLAEEVRSTNEPRVLIRNSEEIAVVVPVVARAKKRRGRMKTKADYETFRAAAGGWADVDTDKLIEDIYEARRRSNRPPIPSVNRIC